MIKAILFDYDGTLSDRTGSAYRKMRHDLPLLVPGIDMDSIEAESMVQELMTLDEFGHVNKKHVYETFGKRHNLQIDIDKMRDYWNTDFCHYQILQDDCLEILDELRKKYKLGVLTNGSVIAQRPKLELMEIDKHVDYTLVSGETPYQKPDPRVFMFACEQMDVKPEEVVFVGDTFHTDIVGALNCGMEAIWICSDPQRTSDWPVKRIYKLKELREIL